MIDVSALLTDLAPTLSANLLEGATRFVRRSFEKKPAAQMALEDVLKGALEQSLGPLIREYPDLGAELKAILEDEAVGDALAPLLTPSAEKMLVLAEVEDRFSRWSGPSSDGVELLDRFLARFYIDLAARADEIDFIDLEILAQVKRDEQTTLADLARKGPETDRREKTPELDALISRLLSNLLASLEAKAETKPTDPELDDLLALGFCPVYTVYEELTAGLMKEGFGVKLQTILRPPSPVYRARS